MYVDANWSCLMCLLCDTCCLHLKENVIKFSFGHDISAFLHKNIKGCAGVLIVVEVTGIRLAMIINYDVLLRKYIFLRGNCNLYVLSTN